MLTIINSCRKHFLVRGRRVWIETKSKLSNYKTFKAQTTKSKTFQHQLFIDIYFLIDPKLLYDVRFVKDDVPLKRHYLNKNVRFVKDDVTLKRHCLNNGVRLVKDDVTLKRHCLNKSINIKQLKGISLRI